MYHIISYVERKVMEEVRVRRLRDSTDVMSLSCSSNTLHT